MGERVKDDLLAKALLSGGCKTCDYFMIGFKLFDFNAPGVTIQDSDDHYENETGTQVCDINIGRVPIPGIGACVKWKKE